MKKLKSLTTQELVNRAIITAIGLMCLWVFSITMSIITTMTWLAGL